MRRVHPEHVDGLGQGLKCEMATRIYESKYQIASPTMCVLFFVAFDELAIG